MKEPTRPGYALKRLFTVGIVATELELSSGGYAYYKETTGPYKTLLRPEEHCFSLVEAKAKAKVLIDRKLKSLATQERKVRKLLDQIEKM